MFANIHQLVQFLYSHCVVATLLYSQSVLQFRVCVCATLKIFGACVGGLCETAETVGCAEEEQLYSPPGSPMACPVVPGEYILYRQLNYLLLHKGGSLEC